MNNYSPTVTFQSHDIKQATQLLFYKMLLPEKKQYLLSSLFCAAIIECHRFIMSRNLCGSWFRRLGERKGQNSLTLLSGTHSEHNCINPEPPWSNCLTKAPLTLWRWGPCSPWALRDIFKLQHLCTWRLWGPNKLLNVWHCAWHM